MGGERRRGQGVKGVEGHGHHAARAVGATLSLRGCQRPAPPRCQACEPPADVLCENDYFTEMCSSSEEGSYLMLIDFCIAQL